MAVGVAVGCGTAPMVVPGPAPGIAPAPIPAGGLLPCRPS